VHEEAKQEKKNRLLDEIKAGLSFVTKQREFRKVLTESDKPNEGLIKVVDMTILALNNQLRAFMKRFNQCTKRVIEVVLISDAHSKGYGVEITVPNKDGGLKKFQHTIVFDVKAEKEAIKRAGQANWKYFTVEDVDVENNKYWTEVK
jgi:hypothetical protein